LKLLYLETFDNNNNLVPNLASYSASRLSDFSAQTFKDLMTATFLIIMGADSENALQYTPRNWFA
jgi:hypothetical protein